MTDEHAISDILIQWDELRQAGEEPSVEELCSDCPELTNEVASRIQALKNTDWMFGDDTAEDDAFLSLPNRASPGMSADSIELPATKLTAEAFAAAVADSGLAIDDELKSVREKLPAGHSTVDLARELIWNGYLSVFQASTLLYEEPLPLVLGDYEIRDRIGAGGMGEVYKASHRRMKRVVALKILPAQLTDDEAALKRFNREVEIVASLEHPNIVTAHDAGEQDGTHYLIMQFVDGCDLATLVRTRGGLSVERVIDFTLQAARGLAHAHRQGVIHRDIKPSNILINRREQVKILDLGLARVDLPAAQQMERRDGLTTTGAVMGTVDYMAPEQAVNTRTADHRADIYSLGCTLHFLLTAEPPYSGETMMERLLAHREQDTPSLRDRRNDVPAELDAIFQRLLAKQPDERFASMTDVVEALESLCGESARTNASLPDSHSSTASLPDALAATNEIAFGQSVAALYSQSAVNVDQLEPEPELNFANETLNQSTAGTEPSLAPTVIKPATPGTTAGSSSSDSAISALPDKPAVPPSHIRWIALGVLLLGAAFYAASPLFKVKTLGGTLVFEGDPAVLQHATVLINEEEVDLNIDGKTFTVGVDKSSGEVRVVNADGTELLAERFTFKVGQNRLPFTVSSGPHDMRQSAVNASPHSAQAAAWQPGTHENVLSGIVPRPAKFDGIKRWTIETILPRTGINSVDYSPDGRCLALGMHSGQVRLLDAETLQLIDILTGHSERVLDVAWSPDGNWLAAAGAGPTVMLWESTGKLKSEILLNDAATNGLAWSHDSRQLAVGLPDQVEIWTAEGRPTQRLFAQNVNAVRWSPDGRWIVTGSRGSQGGRIRLFNAANGKAGPVLETEQRIYSIAWSPDSSQFATGHNSEIRLWNVDGTAEGQFEHTHDQTIHSLSWSPQNKLVSVSTKIVLHDLNHPEQVVNISGPGCNILGVCWRPDGARFATVGEQAFMNVWNSHGQLIQETRGHGGSHDLFVNWNENGTYLAFHENGKKGIRVWTVDGDVTCLVNAQSPFAWDPQENRLLIHDGSQRSFLFHDLDGGVAGPGIRTGLQPDQMIEQIAFSPDGNHIAFAHNKDGQIEIRDRSGKQTAVLKGHEPGQIHDVEWSPSGLKLASSSADKTLRVWTADGILEKTLDVTSQEMALAWNPTGDLIATASGFASSVWKLSGDRVASIKVHGSDNCVDWSPDGRQIITGNWRRDLFIHSPDGIQQANLLGHDAQVRAVAWSPDGSLVASAAQDATAIIWDADTHEPVWVGVQLKGGNSATFTAAGQIIDGDLQLVEDYFVYIVEHEDGRRQMLKPSEFEERIGQSICYEQPAVDPAVSSDRQIAETVIRLGGQVNIDKGASIDRVADFGTGDFHVTDIHLRSDPSRGIEIVVEDGALSPIARLSKLDNVSLTGPWVTDEVAATLARVNSVYSILIGGSHVTNRSLEHLARLPNLRHLQIESDLVDDEGLRFVGHMSELRNLYCSSQSITDQGLANLNSLGHLELLHLSGCPKITDGAIQSFTNRRQIEDWNLAGTKITDEGVQQILAQAESLQALTLNRTNTTDKGLAGVEQRKELRLLLVNKTSVTGEFLQAIHKKLPNCRIEWDGGVIEPVKSVGRRAAAWVMASGGTVKAVVHGKGAGSYSRDGTLPAGDIYVTDINLANTDGDWPDRLPINGLQHLESLDLRYSPIQDSQWSNLTDLPSLKDLSIGLGTALSDASLENLTRFPQLEFLECKVFTDAGIESISRLGKLRVLHLRPSQLVTAGSLKSLAALEHLDWLMVDGGEKITWEALTTLSELPKLRSLSINSNNSLAKDSEGMQSLSAFEQLRQLKLIRMQFADPSLKQLPVMLHVEELSFDLSNLTTSAAERIGQFSNLKKLGLAGNTALTDASLPPLKSLARLELLDLRETSVTEDGITAFAEVLPNCRIEWRGGVIEPKR